MKKTLAAVLAGACLLCGIPAGAAEEETKYALPDAFGQLVVIPYDFRGKAFAGGERIEIDGEYEMVMREGRVMVPIRLLGTVVSRLGGAGYWQVNWDPQKPDEVLLTNPGLGRTVQFTVNSDTMLVNGEAVRIDTPPQNVGGRIVLPLRAAAEAIGKKIDWLEGLILVGDIRADLQHPETRTAAASIKERLLDTRERTADESIANPVGVHGEDIYFFRNTYTENGVDSKLYRRGPDGRETLVGLPGRPLFYGAAIFGDELFFVSETGSAAADEAGSGRRSAALFARDLVRNETREIAVLPDWSADWGWVREFRNIGDELYMILHYGDNTMGSETLFRIGQDSLTETASAKTFVGLTEHEGGVVYASFHFMLENGGLYRADPAAGETTQLGEEGFVYGVYRSSSEGGLGYNYSGDGAVYVRNGGVYTLGFRAGDLADSTGIYRVDAAGGGHVKIASSVRKFWMDDAGGDIFYVDDETGYLMAVGADGGEARVVAERNVTDAVLRGSELIYADAAGGLYVYSAAAGGEKRVDGPAVNRLVAAADAVYYVSEGYEPGLYRVLPDGRAEAIVRDYILNAAPMGVVVVYTLTYEEGIFRAK